MKFGKKGGKAATSSKKSFSYKPLSKGHMESRKSAASGDRESYIKQGIKFFKPHNGDNTIRVLPPGWDTGDEGGYGVPVSVHYGIGADQSAFLCLKMKDEDCPICAEREKAVRDGDDDYAQELRASKRIAIFVIDRKKEGDGPMLWVMPSTLEKDMASVAIDKKTGEIVQFIDPDEGFDFSFEKQGEKMKTKYIGAQFDRKSSPLSDDPDTQEEWLNYVQENPIPDLLEFAEASHIKKVFGAAGGEDEEDDTPKAKSKLSGKSEKAAPAKKGKAKEEPELPTWDEVHEMDEDEIVAAAEEHGVEGIADEDFSGIEEAQDWLCEQLEIEKPKKGGKAAIGKKKAAEPEEPEEEEEEEEEEAELPTWEEMHEKDEDELTEIANEQEDFDMEQEFDDLEDFANKLCEHMGIEAPKKSKASIGKKKAAEPEEPEDDELPTWDEVHELDEDELAELADKHELDMDQEFDDLTAAADYVCEQLEIEAPKKKPGKLSGLKPKKK